MRIIEHPILGPLVERKKVTFTFNHCRYTAYEGETVAAALIANDIKVFRYSCRKKEPRFVFCGIGKCNDCSLTINGVANVKSCITRIEEGMIIQSE